MRDDGETIVHVFWRTIRSHFGLRPFGAQRLRVLEKLEQRAAALELPSPAEYARRLAAGGLHAAELEYWATELTVNETYFFRNSGDWDAVRHSFLPEHLRRHRGWQPYRALSLGCASGEEAYTLAMLLNRYFPMLQKETDPIEAGDIDTALLRVADAGGPYTDRSVRLMPEEFRLRYVESRDGKSWIRDEIKKLVRFRALNVLSLQDAFRNRQFDLILCRNVLIYFDHRTAHDVLRHAVRLLAPGGHLIIGHSEAHLADEAGFTPRITGGCLWIRSDDAGVSVRAKHDTATRGYRGSDTDGGMPHPVTTATPAGAARTSHQEALVETVHPVGSGWSSDAPRMGGYQVERQRGDDADVLMTQDVTVDAAVSTPGFTGAGSPQSGQSHVWRETAQMLTEARSLVAAGRDQDARTLLTHVLMRGKEIVEARVLLAMIHLGRGELDHARQEFEAALATDSTHVMGRLQCAMLCQRLEDRHGARSHYQRLIDVLDGRNDDEIVDTEHGLTIGFIRVMCRAQISGRTN